MNRGFEFETETSAFVALYEAAASPPGTPQEGSFVDLPPDAKLHFAVLLLVRSLGEHNCIAFKNDLSS